MAFTLKCWSCGHASEFEEIFKTDTCTKCDADLKCCRCCRHYDESASNSCKETMADYVHKKDRANFCEYYSAVRSADGASGDEVADAKAKLEALFKN